MLRAALRCPEGARPAVGADSLPTLAPYPMFADDLDPATALAAAASPRRCAVGLVEIETDTVNAAPPADRHQARAIIGPSLPARCPACGLLMEWPDCCWGEGNDDD